MDGFSSILALRTLSGYLKIERFFEDGFGHENRLPVALPMLMG
jgi:hypothetical protein